MGTLGLALPNWGSDRPLETRSSHMCCRVKYARSRPNRMGVSRGCPKKNWDARASPACNHEFLLVFHSN